MNNFNFEHLLIKGVFFNNNYYRNLKLAIELNCSQIGIKTNISLNSNKDSKVTIYDQSYQFEIYFDDFEFLKDFENEQVLEDLSGFSYINGKNKKVSKRLKFNYLSTLSASLIIQLLFSGLIGLHKKGLTNYIRFTSLSAAFIMLSQYIADDTCSDLETNEPKVTNNCYSSNSSFKSSDNIRFELECLNPEIWKQFWTDLSLDNQTIAVSWPLFMQRYAKAKILIPIKMKRTLNNMDFSEISKIGKKNKMHLVPIQKISDILNNKLICNNLQNSSWDIKTNSVPSTFHQNKIYKDVSDKLPLEGVNILESTRRIQGPMASHILNLLGAKVTRIEPMGGDPLKFLEPSLTNGISARYDALNQNKVCLEINIKTNEGQKKLKNLLNKNDIFIQNWAPKKDKELNLDFDKLKKYNQRIIYSYTGGWGQMDSQVPFPGTDFAVQAYSGVADMNSDTNDKSGTLVTILDVLGGFLSSQGVIMSLYYQLTHNESIYCQSSLLSGASLLIKHYMELKPNKSEDFDKDILLNFKQLDIVKYKSLFSLENNYYNPNKIWRTQ